MQHYHWGGEVIEYSGFLKRILNLRKNDFGKGWVRGMTDYS